MRRWILAAAAVSVLALTGCIATLDGAYDEQARSECDQNTRGSARTDCYEGVESNRRARERD